MLDGQWRNLGKLGGVGLIGQITNRIKSLSKWAYTDSNSREGSAKKNLTPIVLCASVRSSCL
jgi:hypothetical protein